MKVFASAILAGFLALGASAAHAVVIPDCQCTRSDMTGSFSVSVWQQTGNQLGTASQAASPTNPIATNANLLGAGLYSGALDFTASTATATVGSFLTSSDGSISGFNSKQSLTAPRTQAVTLYEFTFTSPTGLSQVSFDHDDGISLYQVTSHGTSLVLNDANTTQTETRPIDLAAGTYQLWYADVNGAPATLRGTDCGGDPSVATPEPASLAVLAVSLATAGIARRRRAA